MDFPEPRDLLLEFVNIAILFPLVGGGACPAFSFPFLESFPRRKKEFKEGTT